MKTSAEYLDAIKAKHRLPSDYAAAKLLDVTRSAVSNYRHGRSGFDEDVAIRAAELLDCDAEEVLLAAQAERAKDDRARALWLMLAKKAGYAASVALFAAGMVSAPTPARAAPSPQAHDWYYVNQHAQAPRLPRRPTSYKKLEQEDKIQRLTRPNLDAFDRLRQNACKYAILCP